MRNTEPETLVGNSTTQPQSAVGNSRQRRGRPLKSIDIAAVAQRRSGGECLRSIARVLGVSHSTLMEHIRRVQPFATPEAAQPEPRYTVGQIVSENGADFQVLEVDASGRPTKVRNLQTDEIFC